MVPITKTTSDLMKIGLRLLMIGIAVSLVACKTNGYSENGTSLNACTPPCWQNMAPGNVVTAEEVLQQLKTLDNIDQIWQPTDEVIAWYWKPLKDNASGLNTIALRDGKIQSIALSINSDLTVSEVIGKYGPPEYTTFGTAGTSEHTYARLNMYYPLQGMEFAVGMLPFTDPDLEPTSKIISVIYTAPVGSLAEWRTSHGNIDLQPWPGYGKLGVSNSK